MVTIKRRGLPLHNILRQWTQNTSDRWVGAVWPVDRWCSYEPVASSSKRLCLCTWAHFEHKFWQFWNELL